MLLLLFSDTEPPASMEETSMMEECQGALDEESPAKVPESEVEEENQVQEMTLDEWKNLQEQTRPKPEFNIRKPESTVPSKAVVIHKSRYRDDVSLLPQGVCTVYLIRHMVDCLGGCENRTLPHAILVHHLPRKAFILCGVCI